MRALVLGLSLAVTSPVWADQAADIVKKAAPCWSIPGGMDTPPLAEFDVVFDPSGFVADATVTAYKPEGDRGRDFVISATRALQNCGPYAGVTGTVHIVMDPKVAFEDEKLIDPFK
jgi:hypothetical protein